MKLLIVEDERQLSDDIMCYLSKEDYRCEQAFTFDEAMMRIGVYEYDCILLDLMLPGGSGLDILRCIKQRRPETGVIIVSAKNAIDDKVEGLKIGADDYLAKPFHLSELSMRIFALLRRKNFNLTQDNVPHLNDTNIREFASLNQSLTRLMMKDKETYRIQKEFTENASHELQTPIAIIRSKTELLMQEELNESQMQLVGDLHALTIRMGHLNNNLLLLSKIENDQYADMEKINLGNIIMESLPLYQSLRNDSIIHIDDQRLCPRNTIHANRTLLECMLKNLIVNALRHAERNSTIDIRLTDNSLDVSNTSDEGKPLDHDKLFQRFYTDNAKHKGNGLGLAIVKAICQYHHWQVDYQFEAGLHHFIVDFNQTTNTKDI